MTFEGLLMTIKNCEFINNTKSYGGSIKIGDSPYYEPKINIFNCLFFRNTAIYGGSFYLITQKLKLLMVKNNSFIQNWGATGKQLI